MAQPDKNTPPAFQGFADGELGAAPTLELISQCSPADLRTLCESLWRIIKQHHFFPLDEPAKSLISHDVQTQTLPAPLTGPLFAQLHQAFTQAAQVPVRRMPVTLLFSGRAGIGSAPIFANTLRLTVGASIFPDDWPVISLYLASTAPEAWERLAALRDEAMNVLGARFCWSSLGYGFVCDLDRTLDAGARMEALCMRYLGVDLQDPFGTYAFTEANGLRSVNWQVCMAPGWMKSVNPEAAESIAASGTAHGEHLLWQTGEAPSLCDRNSVADHEAIRRYRALDSQLAPLIFVPELPWFPRWNVGTTERWRKRWGEVGI